MAIITPMAVFPFLTSQYAMGIYLFGIRSFSNEIPSPIPLEYHLPVKTFAAGNFSDSQLLNALTMGYISQQEYDETMLIKHPDYVPPEEPEQAE